MRSLDQKLVDQKKSVESGVAACRFDTAQITADSQLKSQQQKRRNTFHTKLQLVLKYLETHYRDECLVSGLAGVEEQLGNLAAMQKDIAAKSAAEVKAIKTLDRFTKKLAGCTNRLNSRKQKMEAAANHLAQEKKNLADTG